MAWSNSEDTAVESLFCEYHQDHRSFCTCLEPTLRSSSPPYILSPQPSHRSRPATDLEADDTKIDPTLQTDVLRVTACVTQPLKFGFNDPPPFAAGHNYRPEDPAEQHAQLFSNLPPEFNTLGIRILQDNMPRDIQEELDRLTTQQYVTTTGGANGTNYVANAHPIFANGKPRHGECGPYSCSVCSKSFCEESRLTRHKRSHKKPHVCPICGTKRTWANHLERHMATHRADTIACPMNGCSKTFRTTANIPRHLQNLAFHGLTKEHSKQVMAEYKQMSH